MNILSLLPEKEMPFSVGEKLGYGAQGEVFSLQELPSKVVKLSKLYETAFFNLDQEFEKTKRVYSFIKDNPYACFARVFDFQILLKSQRLTVHGPQKFIIFFSILEKLLPLEEDEKKVFKTLCSVYNKDIEINKPLKKILDELTAWLIFDKDKALAFWDALQEAPIDHGDVHRRNIMKDAFNNYKLVDFDKASLLGDNNG